MSSENPWIFAADFDMHIGAVMLEAHDHGGQFEVRKVPQVGKLAPKSAVMVAREHLSAFTQDNLERKKLLISEEEFAALEVMSPEEFEDRISAKGYLKYSCSSGGCPLPPTGEALAAIRPMPSSG